MPCRVQNFTVLNSFNNIKTVLVWQTTIVPGIARNMKARKIIATDRMKINADLDPKSSTTSVVQMTTEPILVVEDHQTQVGVVLIAVWDQTAETGEVLIRATGTAIKVIGAAPRATGIGIVQTSAATGVKAQVVLARKRL
jgi:hypothetical protein